MNGEIITKAALARELKVTPPRIAQYIKSGMPTREDGRLNRGEVLNWLAQFKVSGRDRKKGPALASGLLHAAPIETVAVDPSEPLRTLRADTHYGIAARRWAEVDRAKVSAVESVMRRLGEPIARAALEAGIPIAQAANMIDIARLELLAIGDEALVEHGVPGFASHDANLTAVWPQVDWQALADDIGEDFIEADRIAQRKKTAFWRDSSVFASRRDAE